MNGKSERKLVTVVGPTGSGKTAIGVALAKQYNGVIISADSRQVYIGLDIGTNKEGTPGKWLGETTRIIDDIPQLLVDIAKPGSEFTLYNWLTEARRLVEKIWGQGKLPIIVGGTGLYVSALIDGYQLGEGRHSKKKVPVSFESLVLEVDVDRQLLYQRSDQRYEKIFDSLITEIHTLLQSGVSAEWLEKIGLDYRYGVQFATQKKVREFAITDFQLASRRYIRRQLTWWRHHGEPIRVCSFEQASKIAADFLNN